ncbi:MAG TPA: chemotaxis protein CheW, partial [Burkholderiaceae bacterium]
MAHRQAGRLREFSTQLAARLKAAPNLPAEPARLAVRVGDTGFLLDMSEAGEIVAAPEVTPVPWTKPWFHGMANVRGRLLGVIDLLELSGRSPLLPEQALQMVVFNDKLKLNAGFLITRAFGLRNLKDLEPLPPGPATGDGARTWETKRYRDLDGS